MMHLLQVIFPAAWLLAGGATPVAGSNDRIEPHPRNDAATSPPNPFISAGRTDASDAYIELLQEAYTKLRTNPSSCKPTNCTWEEARKNVRVDWWVTLLPSAESSLIHLTRESLSVTQKQDYISSVKCMLNTSSILPAGFAATKNLYDDFVAVHVNQTLKIHGTYNFLGWHRYFIYTFERKMREQCGFKGSLPVSRTVLLVVSLIERRHKH
jgi:hypothetical protein